MLARTLASLLSAEGENPLWLLFQASCLPLTWSWLWIISSVLLCVRRIPRAGEGWAGTTAVTHTLGEEQSLALLQGGALVWGKAQELSELKDRVDLRAKGLTR